MPEIRLDHLHATRVLVAPERDARPRDVVVADASDTQRACPFCPGQEHRTPPEVTATTASAARRSDAPGWQVRVVPNLYPAVDRRTGVHEVVVFGPDHERQLADLESDEITGVLSLVQERLRAIAAQPDAPVPLFFVNVGAAAGASLVHPHGQILATPDIPPQLAIELAAIARWRAEHGQCLVCHERATAGEQGLVVDEAPTMAAHAPHASRFAWELRFVPRAHQRRFEAADDDVLADLAALVARACRALRRVAGDPAYNLVLHSAPPGDHDFHWHLELMPRLAPTAGFEIGSGMHINAMRPEEAARRLAGALTTERERWSA